MSPLRDVQARAWSARGMGYPADRARLTPAIIAEDRASLIREARMWRRLERTAVSHAMSSIYRQSRVEAVLSAYSMRGVWP